jgi:26S proteasome regulatory subunit N1
MHKQAVHQGPAVLGIALIAMAEPLGAQMATRMLEHLLAYGEPPVRRCVPLALALLHVSDPAQQVVDALSRLSHDADTEVGWCARAACAWWFKLSCLQAPDTQQAKGIEAG